MASVVKIVIWNFFALITNSRITHTRFNLCCVALEWVLDFFFTYKKLIIMKISKGFQFIKSLPIIGFN